MEQMELGVRQLKMRQSALEEPQEQKGKGKGKGKGKKQEQWQDLQARAKGLAQCFGLQPMHWSKEQGCPPQ